MFRFENITYLYFLFAAIPLLIIIIFFNKRNKNILNTVFDNSLLEKMIPGYDQKAGLIKNIILLLVLIFLTIALANPQWSNKRVKVKAQSSDIFIALDISQSMLSPDISPSRLEMSKKLIEELILELKGNRIGLIYFAGEAFLKMPLSPDYAASILFVKTAAPYMIENQGTAIEEAIKIAERATINDADNQKALIIISDGEDHDGNAVEASKKAADKGFTIFTIAAGTESGGLIPYIDEFGKESFKKDLEEKYIKTRVNRSLLNEIATFGNGFYYDLNDSGLLNKITKRLQNIQKREITHRSFTDYESQYEYFILIAIALLILYLIYPEKRKE